MRRGVRAGIQAAAASLLLALPCASLIAQTGTTWQEATVGSEWEVYARALAARGLLSDEPWAIRPFSPAVLAQWSQSLSIDHPWKNRLPQRTRSPGHLQWLRPSVEFSDNTGFAWGRNDGPVWQGRGANAWVTAGAMWRWGHFSARLEPLLEYAQNAAFQLSSPAGNAPNAYVDDMRPYVIDLPQRMGPDPYRLISPGQSYVRFDIRKFGIGLSSEDLFWGPGVRNALIFGPNAGGFPHLFFGTNQAVPTPIGRFSTQVVYGRLEQSSWAPPSANSERLGAGLVLAWQPPSAPMTFGFARFYHRDWPAHWTKSDYMLPLGAFFSRPQRLSMGTSDNQLFSAFFSFRSTHAGLEIYGELGKNDRNVDLRDLAVQPENNSAWLLGLFKVFGLDSSRSDFWTVRTEVGDGRASELQALGRGQSTFYQHSPITQGHTELGQLLGTPLIDRSGGIEFEISHFTPGGRLGASLMERQMPPDRQVGMPADQARTQWDLGLGGTIFRGGSDYTFQVGHAWDLNRFPGRDVGNAYIRMGMSWGGWASR